MSQRIEHQSNGERGIFYLFVDDVEAGEITYLINSRDEMVITHTGVRPEFGGKGLGKVLVKAAVELARESGHKMVLQCWYAAAVIEKDPKLQDVLS